MQHVIVRHTVSDFSLWKPAFDEHEAARTEAGCIECTAYQDADNPNDITVLAAFKTPDQAREFTSSESLKEIMQQAGVTSEPDITFLNQTT